MATLLILFGAIGIYRATGNPFAAAGIFAVASLVVQLALGKSFIDALLEAIAGPAIFLGVIYLFRFIRKLVNKM